MNEFIWIGLHALIALLSLNKKVLNSFAPLLLICIFSFYFFVPFGGDRENYYTYFDYLGSYVAIFEPGFFIVSKAFYLIYPSKYFIYFMLDFMILALLLLSYKLLEPIFFEHKKLGNLAIALIIMASVFYFLGSQNVLRQGLSLSFLALSLATYLRGHLKLAIFLSLFAMSIHNATPIFIVSFVVLIFANRLTIIYRYLFVILFTAASYVFIISYLNGSSYIESSHEWAGDRVSSEIKVLVIWASVIITNFFINNNVRYSQIVWLRTSFLFFITPFSFNGEIFARLAVGVYLLDLFLLLLILSDNGKNRHIASVAIILSAGIAPNVLGLIL